MHLTRLTLLEVPLGLLYAGAIEWVLHRMLHQAGKNKASVFAFHWHDHHRASRREGFFDAQYDRPLFTWGSPQSKEAISVAIIALVHAPVALFFPVFTATVWFGALRYYIVHRRAHMDPKWGKQHLPWHYDHHMGKDQNANWCATTQWFDVLMGTRKVYTYDAAGRPITEEQISLMRSVRSRLRSGGSQRAPQPPRQDSKRARYALGRRPCGTQIPKVVSKYVAT
jgi:hypothetical protein